jgi:hypothetical protein
MTTRMTSRERMLAALRHERPDRVPVAPWGLGWLPPDAPITAELIARTDPWLEIAPGCNVVGGAAFPAEVRRDGDRQILTVHAADRTLRAVRTTTTQTTASTEHLCKSVEDVEALLAIPYVRPRIDVEAFLAHRARVGGDGLAVMGVASGLCYPNDMLGTELASYLWATQPDVIARMVQVAADRLYALLEEACAAGVDCVRVYGGEYATQLMGPAAWRELVVPHDARLVEMVHAHGGIVHYHNHGNMRRFLGQIADLGIDSLDPIEQPPYGDIEMDEAFRLVGERVCLVGGLDDMEILETRPLDEIRRRGAELIERVGRRGWMLAGTSSGIYTERAARAFIALAEVAEAMR